MKPNFYRKVLANGMTIILEKRDLPIVSVAFAVRNGGINEQISEKGISHFIEHMIFKGTPTRNSKQIAEEIEKNGGEFNGFTDQLLTAFLCKIASKHLNLALEVLSDMIKNPLFDEKELEKERKVIFEEIKMRRDSPHVYVMDQIESKLYSGTLGESLIGTYKTMSTINREKIIKKFKEVYTPNNLVLCVVGNADFDELVNFVEKNFGNRKGKVPDIKFSLKNGYSTEKRKGIDQANLIFAYHVPLAGNKKSYAADVLSTIMAGGMSSRLFSEIREKRNLAYSVKGDASVFKKFAYNIIFVGTKKENVGKVKRLIIEEFKKVSKELSIEELNQVKEQIIGNYHLSMEDSQSQMVNLLMHEIDGNAKEFYTFEKSIRDVELKDVKKLAKIKRYSFFALLPE